MLGWRPASFICGSPGPPLRREADGSLFGQVPRTAGRGGIRTLGLGSIPKGKAQRLAAPAAQTRQPQTDVVERSANLDRLSYRDAFLGRREHFLEPGIVAHGVKVRIDFDVTHVRAAVDPLKDGFEHIECLLTRTLPRKGATKIASHYEIVGVERATSWQQWSFPLPRSQFLNQRLAAAAAQQSLRSACGQLSSLTANSPD